MNGNKTDYHNQTNNQITPMQTNLYDLMRCYWFDSKIFNQLELININYQMKYCIAFTQNRTGSWGLSIPRFKII